jgi:23S rRNA (cytidine1920-2'-O)/16S rRNA (cytidine1409-2'-O)-methyltransferase
MANKVLVDERPVDKPGTLVADDASVRLREADHSFVSRGGVKLEAALGTFAEVGGLEVAGRICMDVGASTGGFTDCLLQRGAAQVYAVDVGYGQLAWKLVQDPRVVVLDRTNIRTLPRTAIDREIEVVVADCSFIALAKVLPHLPQFLARDAEVVVLVKPQFEVGRERVGKGGIVRDPQVRREAVEGVARTAAELGFVRKADCPSPIAGRDGNVEHFLWLRWTGVPCDEERPSP